nr:nucleoside-diphosphate kinase [Naematelia aurantialba]
MLAMIGGGGTLVSLLLHQPPSWLLSPAPWLIYPAAYFALVPTRLAEYVVATAPALPYQLVGSYIDGMTRGVTIASVPSAIAASGLAGTSWLTPVVLSGLAVSGGGWAVQLLGMHEKEWSLGVPGVLKGGILNTLDFWGGMLVGLVYAVLMRTHAEFSLLSDYTAAVIPDDLQAKGTKALVSPDTARAICVLLLGSLLAARAVTTAFLTSNPKNQSPKTTPKGRAKKVKAAPGPEAVSSEKEKDKAEVVKSPTRRERAATPRKSPRPPKKAP